MRNTLLEFEIRSLMALFPSTVVEFEEYGTHHHCAPLYFAGRVLVSNDATGRQAGGR